MSLAAEPKPIDSGAAAVQTGVLPPRRRKNVDPLSAHGEPLIWLTGGALALSLAMIAVLLGWIVVWGMQTFWPVAATQFRLIDGRVLLGEVTRFERYRPDPTALAALPLAAREAAERSIAAGDGEAQRWLVRTGNFELSGTHFHWISDFELGPEQQLYPRWALVLERLTWGRFYGTPAGLVVDGERQVSTPDEVWERFLELHPAARERWQAIEQLRRSGLGALNTMVEEARLDVRAVGLRRDLGSPDWQQAHDAAVARQKEVEAQAESESQAIAARISELERENARYRLVVSTASGEETELALEEVVRAYPANQLTLGQKLEVYASRWAEFLADDPREANTEGGVFPAIFGTVAMTLIMSMAVVPFGVLAALYMREYAKAGLLLSAVRVAINNLAGVPSIVFGVFGLGFFCYSVGGFIDAGPAHPWSRPAWWTGLAVASVLVVLAGMLTALVWLRVGRQSAWRGVLQRLLTALWIASAVMGVLLVAKSPMFDGFYPERLPTPTFGKGALVWASLTLALMTLPVVIVATEEALAAVPNSMREGSYACGASKWQTIRRIVLPRSMPGIMTGMILAMARGAGEVAPLMLVGAVKLTANLPIDSTPPLVHFDRSFMHLGFHIYDVAFQSPNSEAAKPMVYTATLLLIAIVAFLNISAVWVRTRLRRRFAGNQF